MLLCPSSPSQLPRPQSSSDRGTAEEGAAEAVTGDVFAAKPRVGALLRAVKCSFFRVQRHTHTHLASLSLSARLSRSHIMCLAFILQWTTVTHHHPNRQQRPLIPAGHVCGQQRSRPPLPLPRWSGRPSPEHPSPAPQNQGRQCLAKRLLHTWKGLAPLPIRPRRQRRRPQMWQGRQPQMWQPPMICLPP